MKAKTSAVTGVNAAPIINNSSGKTIIWIWSKQVLIVSSHQQRLIWRKAILRPHGYGFIMSFKDFSNRLPAYRWLSRAMEINRDALLYQSQLRRRIRLQTQTLHMGFWQRLTGIDGFFSRVQVALNSSLKHILMGRCILSIGMKCTYALWKIQ